MLLDVEVKVDDELVDSELVVDITDAAREAAA